MQGREGSVWAPGGERSPPGKTPDGVALGRPRRLGPQCGLPGWQGPAPSMRPRSQGAAGADPAQNVGLPMAASPPGTPLHSGQPADSSIPELLVGWGWLGTPHRPGPWALGRGLQTAERPVPGSWHPAAVPVSDHSAERQEVSRQSCELSSVSPL